MKKSWKKIALVATSIVGIGLLAACSNKEAKDTGGDNGTSDKLVVYSPNSEGLINATIPAFEEKYGIKVELIQAGTGELFKKLESEATSPVADVIYGGTYTLYAQNKDLFEPYVSSEDGNVIEAYRNTNGYSTPYTLDGSVLVVNPDLTSGMNIKSYKDLLNPELKGKIATADPANSSSAYSQLTNILAATGGYDSDDAWKYVTELFTNIDGKISSSSSNVYKTVADGEMAVGLSYEDPVVKLINDGAKVEIVYPTEGVVFLPANSAVIKNAKNMDNAKKFIDFIISHEVQNVLGTTTTNRPVRDDVETSENMKDIKEIKSIEEDYAYVIEHTGDIVKRYNDVFVETQSK